MSKQLLFVVIIEGLLVFATLLLLVHPRLILFSSSDQAKKMGMIGGLFCLCLTFCWSVVFGAVLVIHQIPFRGLLGE